MLADVAHQQPAAVFPILRELLDELDVAPVNAVELARVVVTVATQCVDAAVSARKLVPFFARDFARFAADTNGRVSVKSHGLSHGAPPNLQSRGYMIEDRGLLFSILHLRCSTDCSRFLHVTHKSFSLVHRDVRIGDEGRSLVDHIALRKSFVAPVPWHADLMHDLAVDSERTHPARDQSLGPNLRPRAGDLAPVEILDSLLFGKLGTDFDE